MTERLSHELASLLAEDDGRSDRPETRALLRARLARNLSEGLGRGSRVEGEAGDVDPARAAAFLDCSMSSAERDAVVAELADDAVARSEMAAAAAFLDDVGAQPVTLPEGLAARAITVLAGAQLDGPRASAAASAPIVWWRRPAAWSGLAVVVLAAVVIPTVTTIVWDANEAPSKRDVKGPAPDRGVVATPSGKVKEKDARSCDDANEQARKSNQHPDEAEPDRTGKKADPKTDPPSGATPADDDPCRPKPVEGREKESPPSARPN